MNALHCAGQTITRGGPLGPLPVPWACPREALLSQVDLFRGFDATERADLSSRMRPRAIAAGQAVVRQGDPGECLYVLAEGILDVEAIRAARAPLRDRIAPGEVFGEISLLTGQQRTATVTAALDSLVYEIHREDLDPILRRRPEIAEGLATVMANHQARNEEFDSKPEQAPRPTRDDLLARLRQMFRL
jgi:CRP-like cAMP-binding protein